jgi:hypothetical protein
LKKHDLKENPKICDCITKKISTEQVKRNRWNFYGIVQKSWKEYSYKVARINILFWPTSIKKIKVATIFIPNVKLLSSSYYLTQKNNLKN